VNLQERQHFSTLLGHLAESLDIPDHLREQVEERYHEICDHLGAEDSSLRDYSPELYPQGSFALGTVVRPIFEEDDYDIDLVCRLDINKENTTQQELKDRVGDRLTDRKDLEEILAERRRCWRLDFDEGFHMDVLPAIPDEERTPHSILITDRELRLWQHSNPKDYAAWFRKQMERVLKQQKLVLAESFRMSVDDIPDYQVKTPLQRAVQLLKRHRDLHFQNDPDDKPVSIILTTLAAKAYSNENLLYDALRAIVHNMPDYIERRNGKWWVPNPVNDKENFADKWNEYPERREKFMAWLDKVESDFEDILRSRGADLMEGMKPIFGTGAVNKAARRMGASYLHQAQSGSLRMAHTTGIISSAASAVAGSTTVPKHTFYGGPEDKAD
jgi:hypothetical protein